MNETCPKTGLHCIPGLCRNYEAVKAAYFVQDLEAARLKIRADGLGLTPEEGIVYIERDPAYRHAMNKTMVASSLHPCTPVCLS